VSDRPYSRLYWELLSEFPEVASDCELMGAYALLLIGADMAWDGKESNPFLPRHIKDTTLARLVALKLVARQGACSQECAGVEGQQCPVECSQQC